MSFWEPHKHEWELVGTTYAPPTEMTQIKNVSEHMLLTMMSGVTTFLYKCKDEKCDQFKKQECLGKLVTVKDK